MSVSPVAEVAKFRRTIHHHSTDRFHPTLADNFQLVVQIQCFIDLQQTRLFWKAACTEHIISGYHGNCIFRSSYTKRSQVFMLLVTWHHSETCGTSSVWISILFCNAECQITNTPSLQCSAVRRKDDVLYHAWLNSFAFSIIKLNETTQKANVTWWRPYGIHGPPSHITWVLRCRSIQPFSQTDRHQDNQSQ